ncbi:MAG: sugar phosphate nucleotidyltransferase [Candidatus Sumerlaeaceae bacterium]|nr:sugar phosphate nucleotidyltransferase [Candidatus Sumerlaeaceae bacterium]
MSIAVIMAGGEGKRLRPFTNSIPKPLLPIGRKPIAQLIVERLRDAGFGDIVMSLEYGADLIRAYFRDGSQFGVNIDYFIEPVKLGTAGCLSRIARLQSSPFLVTNGDILTDLDYRALLDLHAASGAPLTLAVRRQELPIPYGVVSVSDGQVISIEEKPRFDYWINAGVYALSPEALGHIPSTGPFDMTDLASALLTAGQPVRVHEITGLWFDLATADDFERAIEDLARRAPGIIGL